MNNKTIIMLIGSSGCGKSTLETGLVELSSQYKKIISTTTRRIRPSETNHVDYHFVSHDEFDRLNLLQHAEFGGHQYGTTVSEFQTDHDMLLIVTIPSSVSDFEDIVNKHLPSHDIIKIIFDISQPRLYNNMLERKDSVNDINCRMLNDNIRSDIGRLGIVPDIIITDDMLNGELPKHIDNTITNYKRK